ncbi:nucleotidyltransferase family protein [Nocardioides sambongensis]|uniref:nucleotidyltransferase family protein n=1 Tax=Nocardioides sambongensis TaxID=2589074 RepID=UPI00112864FA|nr:nucleotidyltransferase family protein [Nocardioides sambongensis]
MTHALLLAAGAGRRMGRPKALVRDASGRPWLHRAVAVLHEGGCTGITVVLGAEAARARRLLEGLPPGASAELVEVVEATGWASGMGASLRAGLTALDGTAADAVLVHLVDLPDVGADVVGRVLAQAPGGPTALARASYEGRPGHPVLIGCDHWAPLLASLGGDRGARDYLATQHVAAVECGDLATGRDVDRPTGDQRTTP